MDKKLIIESGRTALGIEFGSTRIKGVLIDDCGEVLATGAFDWENSLVDGIWTYAEEEFFAGLKGCYGSLKNDVKEKYGITPKRAACLLDTFSCIFQGIIPYGAQMLVAISTAATYGHMISAFEIIPYLLYPFCLAVASLVYIFVGKQR